MKTFGMASVVARFLTTHLPTQTSYAACALTLGLSVSLTLAAPAAQSGQALPYPHRDEPIGDVRRVYDGTLTPVRSH